LTVYKLAHGANGIIRCFGAVAWTTGILKAFDQ